MECQSQRKKLEIINSKTFCLWYLLFINVGSIVLKGERTISYCSTYRIVFVRRKNERKKKNTKNIFILPGNEVGVFLPLTVIMINLLGH